MISVRRNYQSWVANETLEDYSLRYAARSYRRWPAFILANTALGGISFLALEAIGGSITISYGFQNAFPAIVVVCVLIFVTSLPIAYYSARYSIDIDLLTRGAGFGYIGSTITSLIYASFTFIFFALEAAIMAQALELYFGLDIVLGYLLSSLVIIPIVFFGVTLINRLQLWTQPLWIVLLVTPFLFILAKEPAVLTQWAHYGGRDGAGGRFDVVLFGAATGVLFSLSAQIGEQVDYLRFLPERTERNRIRWWCALIAAGPGWIVIGGLKILAGSLLAFLVLRTGAGYGEAVEPIHMYIEAYQYVFDNPATVLGVATLFVVLSQVKINVTNAYAGSLAWSNFFSRLTHYHPGRVVWLVFNVLIALTLMLLGIFETLEAVLSVYSNVAIAWIGALVADLLVLKPLGVSPAYAEFKRAHLYNINPVGCGAMLVASLVSISAYAGLLGPVAQVYSAFIALLTAIGGAIAIGVITRGKYYIARPDVRYRGRQDSDTIRCSICRQQYEPADMAECPFYRGPICSLCCSLDSHCHDACKRPDEAARARYDPHGYEMPEFVPHLGRRVGRFLGLFSVAAALMGAVFLLAYRLLEVDHTLTAVDLPDVLLRIYVAMLVLIAVGVVWIVLSHESRELSEGELENSLRHLELTRKELVESEKMAALGGLVAGVAHEINTPIGIAVTAASYLQQQTDEVRRKFAAGVLSRKETEEYLAQAAQSSKLLLSNADRAAKLIQGFKQVAVDQSTDEHRRFDLHDYMEETLTTLRPAFKGSQHTITLNCAAGIEVDGFPGPLAQVLANLIMNSLLHGFRHRHRGHILVEAEAVDDSVVEIRYSDDGQGIPRPLRHKVFEPFFTTRRDAGGSGLGLHVVYNIVTHKLKGTIELDDDSSQGATFLIRIPRYYGDRLVRPAGDLAND